MLEIELNCFFLFSAVKKRVKIMEAEAVYNSNQNEIIKVGVLL